MIAFMKEMLDKLLSVVLALLPLSPFTQYIDSLEKVPYLGYINYFVPVGTLLWFNHLENFFVHLV